MDSLSRRKIAILEGLIALFLVTPTWAANWATHARRLTGTSTSARAKAIGELRKIRGLPETLLAAVEGPQKALAFDAIATLSLHELLPAMLKLADRDRDGSLHLAIGALLTDQNKQRVADDFGRRLQRATREPVPPVAQMVMLDTLGRLGGILEEKLLLALLGSESFEVRSSVVSYARLRMKAEKKAVYAQVMEEAKRLSPLQLREQATTAADELAALGIAPSWIAWPTATAPRAPKLPTPDPVLREEQGPAGRPPKVCPVAFVGPLEVTIVFGYKDARPARLVADSYERAMLIEHLTAPCTGFLLACGFSRDDDDGDRFRRVIGGRPLHLRIVHASAGADDSENRIDPRQFLQTMRAEHALYDGVRDADVVFYDGHSRDGGGPDFAPPRLAWGNHVDYRWYEQKSPGLKRLEAALRRPDARVQTLGLFSCASSRHFNERLRRSRRPLALITSPQLLYYTDALTAMLVRLSGVLGQWCPSDVEAQLRRASVGGITHVSGVTNSNR